MPVVLWHILTPFTWASSSHSEQPAQIAESIVNCCIMFIVAQKLRCYNKKMIRGGDFLEEKILGNKIYAYCCEEATFLFRRSDVWRGFIFALNA